VRLAAVALRMTHTENIRITDSNLVTVQGIGEESIQAAS
jgi:hypothetical protein